MADRPILFSAPMVRALLDGTKTQTRRAVKNPNRYEGGLPNCAHCCPYGQPGDRLWVREAFAFTDAHEPDFMGSIEYRADNKCMAVDHGPVTVEAPHNCDPRPFDGPWRPSIYMPRWASRITLEVTGVRVERLQDINILDAKAEGVEESAKQLRGLHACLEHCYAYEDLWESINGPGSWDANPWVWVVEFSRIESLKGKP